MEETRRSVLADQAAVVKRALAKAETEARKETRRNRVAILLVLLLLGGCWQFLQPGLAQGSSKTVAATAQPPLVALVSSNSSG